jgi:hypothetical protein
VQALQQQVQQMNTVVQGLQDKLASKIADHINDQEANAVKGYEAQTRRLAALKDALPMDPQDLLNLVREILTSAVQTESALDPALDTTAAVLPEGPGQNAALSEGEGAPMPQGPQGAPPVDLSALAQPQPSPDPTAPLGVNA